MPLSRILVCEQYGQNSSGGVGCIKETWVEAHVISQDEYQLLLGGFDRETFDLFFMGTLGLFCVGFGIGLIIAQVRKLRP